MTNKNSTDKKKAFLITSVIVILVITSFFISLTNDGQKNKKPQAEKGVIKLTDRNFLEDANLKLDGEWELYWNRLLEHKDLHELEPDIYANVPNSWNEYSLQGNKLPGEGYATYRLRVITNLPEGTMLGFRIYTFSSAYKLYIDEELVASKGTVAQVAAEEIGEYDPQAVLFEVPASEFDIIIQVSNFHYARGGFWYSVYMGGPDTITDLHDSLMAKQILLSGALLMISMFFIAIYILRRELKYTLAFALLCLSILVLADMVGQLVLVRIFPGISFELVILLWYSSTAWVLFFLVWYVHELYTSKFSNLMLKICFIYAFINQIVFILTPITFFTEFGQITNYTDIIFVICTVVIVIIGVKKGHSGGWLNIMSLMIVLVTYIHDILYWTNEFRSPFGEIFYLGLFLFIFIQMVIQAQRIKLYHEHKTAAELQFLQAQIKPHFLYNTLNTVISVSRYDTDEARKLLVDFSKYLRRSFDFEELSQFVPLKHEIELAQAYVEIEKARFEERLVVMFEVPANLEIKVPAVMLQPLIENAVIHGILPKPEGGRIDVTVLEEAKTLIFTIKDNGVGMDKATIMEPSNWVKNLHTKEKGIGLANIDSRLRNLFGKGLEIKSSPGMGTEITWRIPIDKQYTKILLSEKRD